MKITEAQLKQLIRESLSEVMDEEDMDEGFFGNLWGGVKNAAQSTGQGIAQRANTNAQNRESNTRYQGYGMQQDTRNQDFFNQGDMNKAKFSSRMAGAQQAHRKMRNQQQPQKMVAESRLDRIIRESIKKHIG